MHSSKHQTGVVQQRTRAFTTTVRVVQQSTRAITTTEAQHGKEIHEVGHTIFCEQIIRHACVIFSITGHTIFCEHIIRHACGIFLSITDVGQKVNLYNVNMQNTRPPRYACRHDGATDWQAEMSCCGATIFGENLGCFDSPGGVI